MLGAGNFANSTLLPAIRDIAEISLTGIVSASGLSARSAGDRFGFTYCAADEEELLNDADTNWIAIATRHGDHARQAMAAMEAGKDVFVEKPVALDRDELRAVVLTQRRTGRRLMVGFNRRFAPMFEQLRAFLAGRRRPLLALYRVNAGSVPAGHWVQDPTVGGGRIIGEACHFLDILQVLAASLPTTIYAQAAQVDRSPVGDEVLISVSFADGSAGTVLYSAAGDRAFGKERLEVFGDGRVAVRDDFRDLQLIQPGRQSRRRERLRTNKGHRDEWQRLAKAVAAGAATPISIEEIVAAHLAAFAAVESMHSGRPVDIDTASFLDDPQEALP